MLFVAETPGDPANCLLLELLAAETEWTVEVLRYLETSRNAIKGLEKNSIEKKLKNGKIECLLIILINYSMICKILNLMNI